MNDQAMVDCWSVVASSIARAAMTKRRRKSCWRTGLEVSWLMLVAGLEKKG